mgnify:CR=1 FL=1
MSETRNTYRIGDAPPWMASFATDGKIIRACVYIDGEDPDAVDLRPNIKPTRLQFELSRALACGALPLALGPVIAGHLIVEWVQADLAWEKWMEAKEAEWTAARGDSDE